MFFLLNLNTAAICGLDESYCCTRVFIVLYFTCLVRGIEKRSFLLIGLMALGF